MSECMTFPETLDEFLEQYQFQDSEEIYTNGSMLIPVFRVKQWFEHIPAVDAVEVVRCRECMWWGNRWTGCPKLLGLVTPDDFFCKYGSPREDDT